MNMKRTSIWLPDDLRKALKALSQRTAAPVSALIRKAIVEHLKRNK